MKESKHLSVLRWIPPFFILFVIIFLKISIIQWGTSAYSNQLNFIYHSVLIAELFLFILVVTTLVLILLSVRERSGWSRILATGIGLGALLLLFLINPVRVDLIRLRNEVRDCQEWNMGALYQGVIRYWEDHHYQNPRGTGLGGKLTQADWYRALEKYHVVWKNLHGRNKEPLDLYRCPLDKNSHAWSYEFNLDLVPSAHFNKTWVVRESWDLKGIYHNGSRGVLYGNGELGRYYILSVPLKRDQ